MSQRDPLKMTTDIDQVVSDDDLSDETDRFRLPYDDVLLEDGSLIQPSSVLDDPFL